MVFVIADGGLGHCQFQTSSQSDECENVQVESKSFVQTEHYKVSKTRNCETIEVATFDENDEVDTKLRTTPTKVCQNDSHHCHDFEINHTKARRLGILRLTSAWDNVHIHTKIMRVAVTYRYVLVAKHGGAPLWFSAAKKVEKCHDERFSKPILGIIHIQ